jgi:formylglycine-generating enzyme required for sulfatase activity
MDLPTEAQWEYAARSRGKNVAVATKDGMPRAGENMIESMDVQPIGTYPPNPLGLHNMSDNVREWTRNWYREDWYEKQKSRPTVPVDPTGPETGEKKVMRGGSSAVDTPRWVRLYGRVPTEPEPSTEVYPANNGFRCVVERDEPIEGPEE